LRKFKNLKNYYGCDHVWEQSDVDPFSELPDTPQTPQNSSIYHYLTMAAPQTSLSAYCREAAVRAKRGAMELAQLSEERKNAWLRESAKVLRGFAWARR